MKATPLLALSLLVGCATAARQYTFENDAQFPESQFQEVWQASIAAVTTEGFVITNQERESGLISTDWRFNSYELLDCGSAPLGHIFGHQARLVVQVGDSTPPSVTVDGFGQAKALVPNGDVTIPCNSTGVIENRILVKIWDSLRGGAS